MRIVTLELKRTMKVEKKNKGIEVPTNPYMANKDQVTQEIF